MGTDVYTAQVVVAGHICIDIIPTFLDRRQRQEALLAPGQLVHVGPAVTATGGVVSNTGLALHRLGVPTRLMGKIGDDLFGRAILDIIGSHDPRLTEGMIIDPTAQSSYTLVISPPGIDRSFIHFAGANDAFGADDLDLNSLAGARIFHFGYPPLMLRMHADGGVELTELFRRARTVGVATSLDMAHVAPEAAAGRTDWRSLLARVLPYVDLFLPSLDEVFYMLDRSRCERFTRAGGSRGVLGGIDALLLDEVAATLIEMGAAIVGLKLSDQGIYLRTTADRRRLAAIGGALTLSDRWLDRTLAAPAFQVEVIGTTGAGDCAVAGFLAALLRHLSPEAALTAAVATGACNVERADAVSGIPSWTIVQERIAAGWPRLPTHIPLPGWTWHEAAGLWVSPNDLLARA
jgi:sugar/nucleoside kinase (ribokinase family)